jgi:hypothetical protein
LPGLVVAIGPDLREADAVASLDPADRGARCAALQHTAL